MKHEQVIWLHYWIINKMVLSGLAIKVLLYAILNICLLVVCIFFGLHKIIQETERERESMKFSNTLSISELQSYIQ